MVEFNHAIELYPDYFQAFTERAQLFMSRNQLAEAEADFNRSLKINEKYAPSLRGPATARSSKENLKTQ
jgi:Tfp pilus assembly protein PilF